METRPMSCIKVLIHFDEGLDGARARDVSQTLMGIPGTTDIAYDPQRNHLLLASYDPAAVSAETLLRAVETQGLTAQLVGL
ncbi:hypothetical protein [Acidiferrobacter sp.]|uniref:hypothetical protein n=1 Tax=Acidiferrobacter sp. TaxID=1872107 RepID=UPI002620E29E|nr:hypothetical protein [Acidiferrobacter sp.]